MEYSQKTKTSLMFLTIFLLFVGIYLFSKESGDSVRDPLASNNTNETLTIVTVENTPLLNGALPIPTDFPKDIPVEIEEIVESATTYYPDNAKQLSLDYQTSKSMLQKYAEYKDYMLSSNYYVEEKDGETDTNTKILLGTKENMNLFVAISFSGSKTLVKLSLLFKAF